MEYIILDKDGELVDMVDYTIEQYSAYRLAHPNHTMVDAMDESIDTLFLIEDEFDDSELIIDDEY